MIPLVTLWGNCYSCCNDIFSQEYVVCGNRHANAASCLTRANQDSTLSSTQVCLALVSPTNSLRFRVHYLWEHYRGSVSNFAASSVTPGPRTNYDFHNLVRNHWHNSGACTCRSEVISVPQLNKSREIHPNLLCHPR